MQPSHLPRVPIRTKATPVVASATATSATSALTRKLPTLTTLREQTATEDQRLPFFAQPRVPLCENAEALGELLLLLLPAVDWLTPELTAPGSMQAAAIFPQLVPHPQQILLANECYPNLVRRAHR